MRDLRPADTHPLLPWVTAALSLTQFLATLLPALFGLGQGVAERSAALNNPAVPAAYAFAVWAPIYLGCAAYGIFQLLPASGGSALVARTRLPMLVAFAANTAWPLWAQLVGLGPVSVVIIATMLAGLLVALVRLGAHAAPLSTGEAWCVRPVISLFAGWITLALFANSSSALKSAGLMEGAWEAPVALALLIGAAGLAATMTFLSRANLLYAATVAWGLAGLVVANIARAPNAEVATVAAGMVVLLCLGLVGAFAFTRRRGPAVA